MTRKSIGIWIRNLTLGGIIVTFALFFGPQSQQGSRSSIGSVNGEEINRALFLFLRDQRREDEQRLRDQGLPARQARDLIDQQVFGDMVRRQVLAQAARARGLEVSDREIREAICANPGFQRDGKCDPELFRLFLENTLRIPDERDYLEATRQDLLIDKLRRYVVGPLRVSEDAARARVRYDQTLLRLRYVSIEREVPEGLEPGAEDTAAVLEGQAERVQAEYDRRIGEFQQEEQVRARHILFTGDEAESDAVAALERLQAGEDFAALAEELSQDAATLRAGGDLGFFPRGRVAPPLEEAAFGAQVGAPVGPIQTDRGFHVLKVEERREALSRTLEDVEVELARELWLQDRAAALAAETAQAIIDQCRGGTSLEEAAESSGLIASQTSEFPVVATRVPGLPPLEGLRETAIALTLDDPLALRPFASEDAFYVFELTERKPPTPERVEELMPRMQTLLAGDSRRALLNAIYTDGIEKAEVRSTLDQLYN